MNGRREQTASIRADGSWSVAASYEEFIAPEALYGGMSLLVGKVMITALAKSEQGVAGTVLMVDQDASITKTSLEKQQEAGK